MKDETIKLISSVIAPDDIGNQIEQETSREVFCTVESISQSEYFRASQSGMNPQVKVTMIEYDYSGEITVEYNSKKYSVYRTFLRNDERIELYLTQKTGVT